MGRRRIAEKERRIEIAGLGNPRIATAAATGGLALRRDPERPAVAGSRARQCFSVGGGKRLALEQARPGCLSRWIEPHQNNDFAAAVAAPTSGPG
jgi:hypothetical protein